MTGTEFLSAFEKIKTAYKPDILTCLANLSNDEVFTPPQLANDILDLLPQELFESTEIKFFDPACKSGIFLREIARRLMKGLEKQIPNEQERRNHIFTKQIYGMAITSLTAQMTRRSLYCSKTANGKYSVCTIFKGEKGNILFSPIPHTFKNGNCIYCGASEKEYGEKVRTNLESHAYEFIHLTQSQEKELKNMKFDVIIGNPPYQMSDGGSGNGISAKPLYHLFVRQAIRLSPRFLSMIIPARWYAGGKGLDDFRCAFLKDKSISNLVDFPKSRNCFDGVDIAGGICYFLWERDRDKGQLCQYKCIIDEKKSESLRNLGEHNVFIRDNIGLEVVKKVKKHPQFIALNVYPRNVFGFVSSARGGANASFGEIKLISSNGIGFVHESQVSKNIDLVNKYKISIGKLNPDRAGVNNASDGMQNIITKVRILKPKEIVTESYLVLSSCDCEEEATKQANYIRTKFVRYLISLTISSMNISRENFQFVPIQDFTQSWTDEKLYKKYGLTQEEIDFIESMIRPMDNTTQNESVAEVDDE